MLSAVRGLGRDGDLGRVLAGRSGRCAGSPTAWSPRTARSGALPASSCRMLSTSSMKPMRSISSASSSTSVCSCDRSSEPLSRWSMTRPGRADDDVHAAAQAPSAAGRSSGRRRSAARGSRACARRSSGRPRRPGSPVRASAPAPAPAAWSWTGRGAPGSAARRRRSCRCRSGPGRARRGRRAAAGWSRPGSATGSRNPARPGSVSSGSGRARSRKVMLGAGAAVSEVMGCLAVRRARKGPGGWEWVAILPFHPD